MHSWNGFIAFGPALIPVGLIPVAEEKNAEFNQLHRADGGRINLKKVCAVCGKELGAGDIVKGYQYDTGKYARFEADEIEALKAPEDKTIRVERFVRVGEIDPVYYEKAYYVEPSAGAQAYHLLRKALQQEGRAGLARISMGSREYLAELAAQESCLVLRRLYFASEIRPAPRIPDEGSDERELQLARILIGNLSAPFRPEDSLDGFQAKLRSAIEQKIAGIPAQQAQNES